MNVKITPGTRIGYWYPGPHMNVPPMEAWKHAFKPIGVYIGPDLGDHLPGARLEQKLLEGNLRFRVGVLFRPDLNKRQKLETILILEKFVPEMFDYSLDWEKLTG